MNMIDLTPLFNAAVAVLSGVAVYYLVPWIRSKTTAAQRENMLAWVRIAVSAAQQLYYMSDGEKRREHALSILRGKGFDVNDESLLNALEAEVLKLHRELEAA